MECEVSCFAPTRVAPNDSSLGVSTPEARLLLASVQARRGANLLATIRRSGLPIAASCQGTALCGRCAVRISGASVAREGPEETQAKRRNRIDEELRLACCLRVETDLKVSASYW